MRKLSEPINGTETYLAAIHEVLCDIRTALVGGGPEPAVRQQTEPPAPVSSQPESGTKRTRTRTPRTT